MKEHGVMLQQGVLCDVQGSGCEVISGLQFGDAQVLTKQGLSQCERDLILIIETRRS